MSRHFLRSFLPLPFVFTLALCTVRAEPELVNIQTIDPSIVVELRYAGSRNCAGKPLYPPDLQAQARPEVARRLAEAQTMLRPLGYSLKIWDAYRPRGAHAQLWQFSPLRDYVADPASGGSLHTWGVAIDATLLDRNGKEVKMPTDFDDFTPAASLFYKGSDPVVRKNLHTLQRAMGRAGFYGMRTEWWHFVSKDWKDYRAVWEPFFSGPAGPPTPLPPAARPLPPPVAPRVRGAGVAPSGVVTHR